MRHSAACPDSGHDMLADVSTGRMSHLRWPLVVSAVIVILAGGLWYAKFRERADASAVQNHLASHYPGSTIGCSELKANGSLWACAVVYRAESICLAVSVSSLGKISPGNLNARRCTAPGLTAMVPAKPDQDAVAADVTRIVGGSGQFICARAPNSHARWACARSSGATAQCMLVRVVPWTPIHANNGGGRCSKIGRLRASVQF
jgi:hypothetical protein